MAVSGQQETGEIVYDRDGCRIRVENIDGQPNVTVEMFIERDGSNKTLCRHVSVTNPRKVSPATIGVPCEQETIVRCIKPQVLYIGIGQVVVE